MERTRTDVWRLFVLSSIALSIVLGFGLGAALFAVRALDSPVNLWWIAAAQAHGHVQLVGWAGLMVLGVGFHFLPRLAGGSAVDARPAMAVLALIGGGIVVRVVCGVILATDLANDALRFGIVVGSCAELAGAIGALVLMGKAVSFPAPLRLPAAASIAPLGILAMLSLALALTVGLVGALDIVRSGSVIVSPRVSELTQLVLQYGFLLPIAVAMSARLFPLYIRTATVSAGALRGIALTLTAGLLMRGTGISTRREGLTAAGALVLAFAGLWIVGAVGILRKRRPLPRKRIRLLTDPLQLHVLSAYAWLVVALATAAGIELDDAGAIDLPIGTTVERHAFGAGFVTILILGVGQVLLPGFDRVTMRRPGMLWLTLVLGNISVVLRVAPATDWDAFGYAESLMGLGGALAIAAIVCFAWNIGLFRIHNTVTPIRQ